MARSLKAGLTAVLDGGSVYWMVVIYPNSGDNWGAGITQIAAGTILTEGFGAETTLWTGRLMSMSEIDKRIDPHNNPLEEVGEFSFVIQNTAFDLTPTNYIGRKVEARLGYGTSMDLTTSDVFFTGRIYDVSPTDPWLLRFSARSYFQLWNKEVGTLIPGTAVEKYRGKIYPMAYGDWTDTDAYLPVVFENEFSRRSALVFDNRTWKQIDDVWVYDNAAGRGFRADATRHYEDLTNARVTYVNDTGGELTSILGADEDDTWFEMDDSALIDFDAPASDPAAQCIVKIDNELMLVQKIANSTDVWVERGFGGTTIASHSIGAAVYQMTDGADRGLVPVSDIFYPIGVSGFDTTSALQGFGKFSQVLDRTGADYVSFRVSGVTTVPTLGAVYTNNSSTFTVFWNDISGGSGTIVARRTAGTNEPSASGDLTKSSGTGDATIAFSVTSGIFGIRWKQVTTFDLLFDQLDISGTISNMYVIADCKASQECNSETGSCLLLLRKDGGTTSTGKTFDVDGVAWDFTVSGVTTAPAVNSTYTNNGSTFIVTWTSISGGAGHVYTRRNAGTNAPDASGTLTKASGTGDASISYSANSVNACAATAHGFVTGDVVMLSTTGTLPTGASDEVKYAVIKTGADRFKLALSIADAQSGTAVDLADDETGTQTVTQQFENDAVIVSASQSGSGIGATTFDNIDGSDDETDVAISENAIANIEDLPDTKYTLVIEGIGSGGNSWGSLKAIGIRFDFKVSPVKYDFWVRGKGRSNPGSMFNGSSGDLMENPSQIIEDFLRREVGLASANMTEADFDSVHTSRSAWKMAVCIYSDMEHPGV